ncbi:MAG: tryptophan halogenase family protein [Myxococcota bacterium]
MAGTEPLKSIVIVGGGSAGWLSACYLQRALGDHVAITLIESSTILPVGVGESTLPTLGPTMAFLGFDEADWMPAVGATYKAAIRFRDWTYDAGSERKPEFFHPFIGRPEPRAMPFERPYLPQVEPGLSIIHYALRDRQSGMTDNLAERLTPGPELVRRCLSPRQFGEAEPAVSYGYHVDAGLLGGFLRDEAKHRGVRHIVDDVVDVVMSDPDRISHLLTKQGEALHADLFIDCSGFRGLLLNKALQAPFESFGQHLLCDAAVAMGMPSDTAIEPCTTSHALSAGWSWNVPLFHRRGAGYVYSSRFASPEEAEAELRTFLGAPADAPARHLRMRVGHTPEAWRGNCVGIGLSAGFIEPLEATGIFLVEYGLACLIKLLPNREATQARRRAYNKLMGQIFSDILDFVVLHYHGSHREDTPFWRAARSDDTLTESLADKLEFFEEGLPVLDAWSVQPFLANSYAFVMDGLDRLPRSGHPLLEAIGYEAGQDVLTRLVAQRDALVEALPDHRAYLTELYGDRRPAG